MNGVVWGLIALVNSGVFWQTRQYVDHSYLTEIAIVLAALGILGLSDFLKQHTLIRFKTQQLALVVSSPFRYHYQHLSAFVQLYKMAPQILAEREAVFQIGSHVNRFDSNVFELNMSKQSKTIGGPNLTNISDSVGEPPPEAASSTVNTPSKAPNAKVVGKKVRTLHYTSDFGDEPRSVFKALGINSRIRGRKTLVIADIGEAELTKVDLQNYLDDRIDLQYWKSRAEGEKFEVLTIDRVLWADYPEILDGTINKLGADYERIFVVRRSDLQLIHEPAVEV